MEFSNILATLPFRAEQRARLQAAAPNTTFRFTSETELCAEDIAEAEALIGYADPALLLHAGRLKWVQLGGVGAEGFIGDALALLSTSRTQGALTAPRSRATPSP